MFLVIATGLWVALSLLVPHLPRRWWQSPALALIIAAPVLVILAAQEMGPDVAGLMSVALLLLIRNPRQATDAQDAGHEGAPPRHSGPQQRLEA